MSINLDEFKSSNKDFKRLCAELGEDFKALYDIRVLGNYSFMSYIFNSCSREEDD